MTILEEKHHIFLIVSAIPLLYEDSQEMVGYLAQAMDSHFQEIAELADLVFCIYSEQAWVKARKAEAKTPGEQRTLEAYS